MRPRQPPPRRRLRKLLESSHANLLGELRDRSYPVAFESCEYRLGALGAQRGQQFLNTCPGIVHVHRSQEVCQPRERLIAFIKESTGIPPRSIDPHGQERVSLSKLLDGLVRDAEGMRNPRR